MLVYLEYFQLTPCLYFYLKFYLYANQLRVYTPIPTWWMLVRFVLSFFLFSLVFFFCLKLVKDFVLKDQAPF